MPSASRRQPSCCDDLRGAAFPPPSLPCHAVTKCEADPVPLASGVRDRRDARPRSSVPFAMEPGTTPGARTSDRGPVCDRWERGPGRGKSNDTLTRRGSRRPTGVRALRPRYGERRQGHNRRAEERPGRDPHWLLPRGMGIDLGCVAGPLITRWSSVPSGRSARGRPSRVPFDGMRSAGRPGSTAGRDPRARSRPARRAPSMP